MSNNLKSLSFLIPFFALPLILSFEPGVNSNHNNEQYKNSDSEKIIKEMKNDLETLYHLWYPLCIDTVDGGYYSDINNKWQLDGRQNKMIVTQARHVWSAAEAAVFYDVKRPFYNIAEHGRKFLNDVMRDKKYGGYYNLVTREGKPIEENGELIKQAYGNAYVIFGFAAYYKAFGDTSALNLAIDNFNWLEKNSYDPKYGGYFQFMARDGKPYKEGYNNVPPKDQNSMIHLLEAYTELYKVWPDAKLKVRLNSLLHLVRDTVVGNKKYMTLFFRRDWTPISYRDSSEESRRRNIEYDHISFGHDVETAYLMLDASHALGIENDTTTLRIAKELDDFALENGWDKTHGGIYDGGYIFKGEKNVKIVLYTKQWWSQVEALNSFLMMSRLYPNDKHNYYDKFLAQWEYIKTYLLDNKYGGWYWNSIDTDPKSVDSPKATIWKANYHTSRGLINCINQLEEIKDKGM